MSKQSAHLKYRRKLWLQVHLYLGLLTGAILAVVGLTGSILVFYEELQEILNKEQIVISAPPEPDRLKHSLDEIIAAAETAKPAGGKLFALYYPRMAEVAYKFLYFVRDAASADNGSGYYVFVNPYTARATGRQFWYFADGDRYWGIPLVSFIMQLHYCLLLGDTGVTIVGVIAAVSLVSVLSGLILWWPLTGKFKQALVFKSKASAVRFNYDLHKTAGFYTVIVLLPILISGIYFNLPDRVESVIKSFSTITRNNPWAGLGADKYRSNRQANQAALPYDAIEAAVKKQNPNGRLWLLYAPQDETGVFHIHLRDDTSLSRFTGYRDFAINQYNGQILAEYASGTGNAADVFLDWQWPLHSGQAFGWTGRILVFLSGLACPVLFVTGVIRWLQKRRAQRAKRHAL